MKFEDFLMMQQQNEEEEKGIDLVEEVLQLQEDLDDQHELNIALRCALHKPTVSRRCQSSLLPLEVQVLLAEVDTVEKEINYLERKVEALKVSLFEERKQNKEWRRKHHQWLLQQQKHQLCGLESKTEQRNLEQPARPSYSTDSRSQRSVRERRGSLASTSEIPIMSFARLNDEIVERSINDQKRKECLKGYERYTEKPNRLSEELVKCLMSIFIKINRSSAPLDCEGSSTVPKLTLSCMNSKGFVPNTTFNCKEPISVFDEERNFFDPYGIMPDPDAAVRDIGPYKNFIQLTRSTLDTSCLSECYPAMRSLRTLMHKLSTVELNYLTYKQKLAFWINIYNACVMHAFLRYGLPSTTEKQLELMNKAALNVGGIVLNALAIEHFILRHPYGPIKGSMDEKETLLRHAYGLGYPEPNITFALCRGTWSSPALRIYTAEEVVNELGKAKVEYLESSIRVTNKKKIVVPKLLHCHMQDFAENMESLLEWIYSQLPQSGLVKRMIMECLNRETKSPIAKTVEVQCYESEFRYLMHVS